MTLKKVFDLHRLMQAKLQRPKKSLLGYLLETFLYPNNTQVFVEFWQPLFIIKKISGFVLLFSNLASLLIKQ